MNREQLQLLKDVMAVDFSALELHLYLDTHPTDQRALMEFGMLCRQSGALHDQYEQRFGPLTPCGSDAGAPWSWIEKPWPWQIDYGRS